ncbi:lysoplasmalogenase [Polaribacter ponticola]|uniref:Lysoplasmalogenase n=1 Tax=Polaribacter ponticola TaxID=2978475 RepID=A0ABT5S6H4_9FLAO|nr:lysoplasmalogenase [Polaribacter sp. MSW5]MDD7913111.1 lysoplasmalogenase [Polaribacter sp. MSW5]
MIALKRKTTIASLAFLVIASLHIVGILFNLKLAFISKPFIITSLVVVYLLSVKKANFWFVSALFFSFWGDVLLLFKEQFFVFGLASFLLAHVLYIKITIAFFKKISLQKIAIACLPFAVFLFLFLNLIKENLGEFKIPVIVYGVVISVFGVVSLLNYMHQKRTANTWLLLGTILFILSDSLIAINKFYSPKEYYQLCIMLTYIVAQYLICKAMIAKDDFQQ